MYIHPSIYPSMYSFSALYFSSSLQFKIIFTFIFTFIFTSWVEWRNPIFVLETLNLNTHWVLPSFHLYSCNSKAFPKKINKWILRCNLKIHITNTILLWINTYIHTYQIPTSSSSPSILPSHPPFRFPFHTYPLPSHLIHLHPHLHLHPHA